MDISILIATHNRVQSLQQTLRSFEESSIPDNFSWEIIVIDNGSNDETWRVVRDMQVENTLPLNYVFEEKRGWAVALNTGAKQAKGEILAVTDDDCIIDPLWVANIIRVFRRDETLAVIGGRVELYNKNDKPVSIRPSREKIIFSSPSQLYSLIIGCNMAFSRRAFDVLAGFDPLTGPGSQTGSGADIDILYRAYRKKMKIIYMPEILVYHNHGRITNAQVQILQSRYAIGRGAFYYKYIIGGDFAILKIAYWEVGSVIKTFFRNLVSGEPLLAPLTDLRHLATGAIRRLRAACVVNALGGK